MKEPALHRILALTALLCFSLVAWNYLAAQEPTAGDVQAAPARGDEPQAAPSPQSLVQILFSGGRLGTAIMLVLIGLSLTAAYLVFDNLMLVRRTQLLPEGLSDDVRGLVQEGDLRRAATACNDRPSFLAFVLLRGLSEVEGGWVEVEKAMEDATAEQAARLFRRVEFLSVIGNIAPMVGLLGTVSGMLLAFREVAQTEGSAGAAQLADGIYQALVTTVVGLTIAIPALGAFALFRSRVDQLVAEAAYAALHALSPLKQRRLLAASAPPQQPKPPPPPKTAAPPGRAPG
jgi:biopolymer transport protein ExbB